MSDNYQAVYDAVRSRIHGCDTGDIVRSAVGEAFSNTGHLLSCIAQEFSTAAYEMQRPAVIFKPTLTKDGDKYCFLLGADLMQGVSGFGETPAKAAEAFDAAWYGRGG